MMDYPKFNPVKDPINLRNRVSRFFNAKREFVHSPTPICKGKKDKRQMDIDSLLPDESADVIELSQDNIGIIESPHSSITEFLCLVSQTLPEGDLYLFGGILRDLALFGRKGFSSDIDIVVDGDWSLSLPRMIKLGAEKNKFGGLRFYHNKIPIDIWPANETWAIKEGHVEYSNVESLLNTTVLNWDAILMNWRTKTFLFVPNYFEDINNRHMDIVLDKNPNPLGMTVRVLRHLLLKDAQKLSESVFNYLKNATENYSFDEIKESEVCSYGKSLIHQDIYFSFKKGISSFSDCEQNYFYMIEQIKNPTRNLF